MKTAFLIIYIVLCALLVVFVAMQEGKNDAGKIFGGTSSVFWDKAQKRTKEKRIEKLTILLSILFFAASVAFLFGGRV